MVDPRKSIIETRLAKIGRIIAVSSGKGGVGKSMVATMLGLTLAKDGSKVGLFDLDFTSPSTHIIMGAKNVQPREEKGLIPPIVHDLEYMSLIYFVGDKPTPLRGVDTSNALIELLTITQWDKLDFLVIDMPPGIGDPLLDLVRFIKRVEFLIVTTSSLLAFETVKKQVSLLRELNMPIIGVIENMKMDKAQNIANETGKLGLIYLTGIPFDPQIENAIGNTTKLFDTAFFKKIKQVIDESILAKKRDN